jgi:hypothetical protein
VSNPSFGRSAFQLTSIADLLSLERSSDRAGRFENLDGLIGDLLLRSLRGQRIVRLVRQTRDDVRVVVDSLTDAQRSFVESTFTLTTQQRRGAWFLPEEATLRAGWVNLPQAMRQHERFAAGIAWEEREKVSLRDSADALLLWALLEPLAELLYRPFALRGPLTGTKAPEETAKLWTESATFLNALGLDIADELAVLRPGKGWSKLRAGEQYAAKQQLMDALARQVTSETSRRYRAYQLRTLISQYYRKAKGAGQAKRTQVITKALERPLSAFFGGDWLAFLDYLGETPHPEEQIVTQLPKARLYVGTSSRAAEIAAQQGLPVEEVERMLATFWQQPAGASPVEQRVKVLRSYWEAFDVIHARQAVGMSSLWGLIEERMVSASLTENGPAYPQAFLYRRLLPAGLVAEVDHLWGTTMLARYPECIVSETYPHAAMAEAFGPALTFWHGCALTAWFLCEGPSSRTDMAGLAEYHRRDVARLADYGTPISPQFFNELIAAEQRLGPPVPINQDARSHDVGYGISITITVSTESRRPGFERLRDIITRHRRAWAQQYLDTYLRARWEIPLRSASETYNKSLHDKGKPPTAKQVGRLAAEVTNAWFGGDLHAFYGAIGEKAPLEPVRRHRLPHDRERFVRTVFARLGGRHLGPRPDYSDSVRYDAYNNDVQTQWMLARLAELSLKYVQLWEVLDRPPTMEEVGGHTFEEWSSRLNDSSDALWERYSTIVTSVVGDASSGADQARQLVSHGADAARPALPDSASQPNKALPNPVEQAASQTSLPSEQTLPRKRSWLARLLRPGN